MNLRYDGHDLLQDETMVGSRGAERIDLVRTFDFRFLHRSQATGICLDLGSSGCNNDDGRSIGRSGAPDDGSNRRQVFEGRVVSSDIIAAIDCHQIRRLFMPTSEAVWL